MYTFSSFVTVFHLNPEGLGENRMFRGEKVCRRRRRARKARGSRRRGVWGVGSPLPTGEGSGEETVPPPQIFFFKF